MAIFRISRAARKPWTTVSGRLSARKVPRPTARIDIRRSGEVGCGGTATIMTCCSERLHELAAKVGVGGFDGHYQVRNFGDQCPHRSLAHFRDQLLDSSKPGARVVRMDRADSAGMASVPGLQQRQHLADVNLADAGADRGNYARGRSRMRPVQELFLDERAPAPVAPRRNRLVEPAVPGLMSLTGALPV